MTNLILCGGSGTRLWPLSRTNMPKQFYPLFGGKSIFQLTIERNRSIAKSFFVASNQVQMDLARNQLAIEGVADFGSLVEPVGRNTAPAIALVCLALKPDELVLVTPSDHLMTKHDNYLSAMRRAVELARQGRIVTFGIRPTSPETGFGYIEAEGDNIASFREKPDLETAKTYLASGRHLWNSGMFVFRAGVMLEELARWAPEVLSAAKGAHDSALGQHQAPSTVQMQAIPSISIDYAVMERTSLGKVVACDPGWTDLGSFDALFDEIEAIGGNRVLGSTEPVFVEAQNNLVVSAGRKVALVDVEDLIVIDTADALLITKRGSSQKVKDLVVRLKEQKSPLLDHAPQN